MNVNLNHTFPPSLHCFPSHPQAWRSGVCWTSCPSRTKNGRWCCSSPPTRTSPTLKWRRCPSTQDMRTVRLLPTSLFYALTIPFPPCLFIPVSPSLPPSFPPSLLSSRLYPTTFITRPSRESLSSH